MPVQATAYLGLRKCPGLCSEEAQPLSRGGWGQGEAPQAADHETHGCLSTELPQERPLAQLLEWAGGGEDWGLAMRGSESVREI